jgi:hypothetical protein
MTPNHANSPEVAKPTGRAWRVATKVGLTAMQIAFGAACLIGTFWGVTQFLAGDFEPHFAGRAQPTSAEASATPIATSGVLARATQVRLAEMPEIKGAVPELAPVRASAPTTSRQPHASPALIRTIPISKPDPKVAEVSAGSVLEPTASDAERLSAPSPHIQETRLTAGRPALSVVPQVPPDARLITSRSSEPSALPQVASAAPNAEPEPETVGRADQTVKLSVAAAAPEPAQETDARPDREANETAKVAAAAMPPSRTDAQAKSNERKAKAQGPRAEDAKRTNRPPAQPPSSATAATSRSNAAPKRNEKPATAQRTRVAAAQPEASMPPTPPPATAEPAEQRVHLLGITLPTGRKVRECLLEWRC